MGRTNMKRISNAPELSRPLQVDKIPLGGIEERIVASPLERKALAARFGVEDIPSFEAFLNVDRAENGMLAVTGVVRAKVVQSCVVTLEPVSSTLEDVVDALFAPGSPRAQDSETILWNDLDPPEPIRGGVIDLGELAAQHFGIALDPYPRKEGAVFRCAQAQQKDEKPVTPLTLLKSVIENKEKTKR